MTNAGPLLATSGAVICARTVLPDTTVVARMDPFQYTAAFGPKPYHWTVRVKPLLPEATLAGTSGRTNQRGTRHQLGNLSATSRPSSVPSLAKNRVSDNVGPCQVTYGVVASKIDDGYADFGLTAPVKVTITPEEPLASVILKLGPRAGILIPLVKNKITGKPVSDFLVKWRVDVPGGAWQGASGFSQWTTRTSIPAAKDVSLEVSANGYRTWVYIDPSNQSRPSYLRLESGERKSLSIELQPEAKNTSTTQ